MYDKKKIVIYACCGLTILLGCWVLFHTNDDDQRGMADATQHIQSVRSEQQRAQEATRRIDERLEDGQRRITEIEEGHREIERGLERIEARGRNFEELTSDNDRRIAEGRAVLEAIRKRNEGQ